MEYWMKNIPMFHDGSRALQDQFATRKLADRLVEVYAHTEFTDEDRAFIERMPFFFLATADEQGHPDCSYKGGMPGFIRIIDSKTLAFPNYDGNGMFKSFGNVLVNAHVGLLFVDFENCSRLRMNGVATVHKEDELLKEFPGATMMIRVRPEAIFPNCPRYVHRMLLIQKSRYVPQPNYSPPVPGWKREPGMSEFLPPDEGIPEETAVTWTVTVKNTVKRHIKMTAWKIILWLRG
jgi:predicted pyridoxine 5'-phosphate oxidase superfamily flavin-nucleotide-binding protein